MLVLEVKCNYISAVAGVSEKCPNLGGGKGLNHYQIHHRVKI